MKYLDLNEKKMEYLNWTKALAGNCGSWLIYGTYYSFYLFTLLNATGYMRTSAKTAPGFLRIVRHRKLV